MTLDPREVKRRCDFVALVGRYTPLYRFRSQWRAQCPFHSEHNPSFYIEQERKLWKCFGCDRGGDLFDFVMLAEGCDFPRALRIVADFVRGVASASEPRSGERLGRGEGGEAPSARAAGVTHSPKERAEILSRLDATERRNSGIARTNAAALAELASACERGDEELPVGGRACVSGQRTRIADTGEGARHIYTQRITSDIKGGDGHR